MIDWERCDVRGCRRRVSKDSHTRGHQAKENALEKWVVVTRHGGYTDERILCPMHGAILLDFVEEQIGPKKIDKWRCCGGNGMTPPQHCQDCPDRKRKPKQ